MTRRSIISALPLPVLLPRVLSAMGDTVRISIDGSDLASPVEITEDVGVFNVWSGPSTTSNEGQSFIVNWAGGAVQPPNLKPTYQVSFHTTRTKGPKIYRVLYQIDPSAKTGYVYIPGSDHPAYKDNTWLILRMVEGKWFRAWNEWEKLAHPLIAKARKA